MNSLEPTDRLIVALDVPNRRACELVYLLRDALRVRWFKISDSNLLETMPVDFSTLRRIIFEDRDARLMVDLKTRDNPDSVTRIVRAAFDAGATYVTVTAEAPVVDAALIAIPPTIVIRLRWVLPVGSLTSEPFTGNVVGELIAPCRGAVVPAVDLRRFRARNPDAVLVTPGVRLLNDPAHDHEPSFGLMTPAEAVRAGATRVVVGRPIILAADPVAAARRYLENLGSV